ncbi:ROK family transcriptional regulator [Nocardia takedensis]
MTARGDSSAGAVLRAVLAAGPLPRSAVAKWVGLSPATVTWQTRALVEAGLLVELPETVAGSGVGRPFTPLALNAADNVVISVHVAATRTTVAVVDLGGGLRSTSKVPHRDGGAPADVLADAAAEIERVRAGITERVLGVGVAVGGRVDRAAGTVIDHSFLGWREVAVRDTVAAATGLPTELDSHTRGLMHAEHLFGRLRGTASSVVLFVGNVVDVAFAVGDRVHYGPRSAAGSITRMLGLRPTERTATGTVDPLSDHDLLLRARRDALPARTVPELLDAAQRPGRARELFLGRGGEMGRVTAVLIDLLDPEAVVIVDRGFTGVDGVAEAYLAAVREHSALCANPAELVGRSTFAGRILEMAGAAVTLHEVFRDPLATLDRKAV